jgi:hypothetical protein
MATKASASAAFNSYFYQQTNGAQNGGKPIEPSNGEQSGDLHLKMSKKIAQLTKVRPLSDLKRKFIASAL